MLREGTPQNNVTLHAAKWYVQAGLSVIPVRPDGSKAPAVTTWEPFQERLPTQDELHRWFAAGRRGVAIVGGIVSGNLECIDFDHDALQIFAAWSELIESEAPGLIARLSVAKTPKPGFHVRYRCPDVVIPGNTKLAEDPAGPAKERTLIETRGEGGYALAPGCPAECHATRRTYEHHSGPKLSQIQPISASEREILWRCARSFDRAFARQAPGPRGGGNRPGEDFNRRGPAWEEILEPHGWTKVREAYGKAYWRRPDKDMGWSATTGYCTGKDGAELLAVFSSNAAPFEVPPSKPCGCYSKFVAFALLNHRGDFKAAAKELAQRGYGDPAHERNGYSCGNTRGNAPGQGGTAPEHVQPDGELGTLLSAVKPETVSWLWPGRIPYGKLTILDGDPGLGKSVLTLTLAALVTRGWSMPFEDREPGVDRDPAGVVLLSAEDGLDDTIRPRLDAAGADVERVLALDRIPEGAAFRLPVLPQDAIFIKEAVRRVEAKLVIIDPLTAFLGGDTNTHRDQDVRRALYPLYLLAQQTGAAFVVVRHLNKAAGTNPLYRGGGSIGIIGAARSGLLVAKDPDNPDRRILASTKCNLAKLPPSLAFDLSQAENGALRIGWIGESVHTAESLLAAPRDDEDKSAVQEAVEVLRAILENGPVPCEQVKKDARKAGVFNRTLYRAKDLLQVKSKRLDFGGPWRWYLPGKVP
jgi:hypothetical protein